MEENQRTIHHLITNQQNTSINNVSRIDETRNAELRKVFEEAADKIAREVKEIKKLRDDIVEYG